MRRRSVVGWLLVVGLGVALVGCSRVGVASRSDVDVLPVTPVTVTDVMTTTRRGAAGRCDAIPFDAFDPFVDHPENLELVEVVEEPSKFLCVWDDGVTRLSLFRGGLDLVTPMMVLTHEVDSGGEFLDDATVVRVVPSPDPPAAPGAIGLSDPGRTVDSVEYVAAGDVALGFYGSIVRIKIVGGVDRQTSANEVIALEAALRPFA